MDTFICTMKSLVNPLHTLVELRRVSTEPNCANFLVLCLMQGAQRPHSGTVGMRCIFIVRKKQCTVVNTFSMVVIIVSFFTTMSVLVFLLTLLTLIDLESRDCVHLFELFYTRAVNKI